MALEIPGTEAGTGVTGAFPTTVLLLIKKSLLILANILL